jgi:4'-phosphopantetheinyl transferase
MISVNSPKVPLPLVPVSLTPTVDPWSTVKVWKVAPEWVSTPFEQLLAVLDAEERRRARGRRTMQSQHAYAVAHVCLREILAVEIGVESCEIAFARPRSTFGKPALADHGSGLTFNLSHTRGLILVAVAYGREVGVDVEWIGRRVRAEALSKRYFGEAERSELARAAEGESARCFLQLWTRREAHAKMTGEGLRRAVADGNGCEEPFDGDESRILRLDLGSDHVGAVAIQLNRRRISQSAP